MVTHEITFVHAPNQEAVRHYRDALRPAHGWGSTWSRFWPITWAAGDISQRIKKLEYDLAAAQVGFLTVELG